MGEIHNIQDHMAKPCNNCGSNAWYLLQSGKAECSECGSRIANVRWERITTNREAHEDVAGMPLDDAFFRRNSIDPNAEFVEYGEDQARADNVYIDLMMQHGHTRHCAERLTWGDGECECKRKGGGDDTLS